MFLDCNVKNIEVIGETVVSKTQAKDETECHELCKLISDCKVWTYYTNTCYLKDENIYKVENNNTIAASKGCQVKGKYKALNLLRF